MIPKDDNPLFMFTYEVTGLSCSTNSEVLRKAELYNLRTQQTHYIMFREHDADKTQLSVIFTDEDWNPINSEAILNAKNGHTASEIAMGDILEVIM